MASSMTRQHFQDIADVIKELQGKVDYDDLHEIATRLSYVCAKYNSHFDKYRFMEACGF